MKISDWGQMSGFHEIYAFKRPEIAETYFITLYHIRHHCRNWRRRDLTPLV